jgi:3-phosphoshikimate 1-carboxyvinyltransferase
VTAGGLTWTSAAGGPLRGEIRVPGDKSVSHRAIMFAALADGVSSIDGFLEGEDTIATSRAFAAMGVRIEQPSRSVRRVHGVGLDGLRSANGPIDCGNAGTGMRLLTGILAGQSFDSTLVGDASLSRRPMRRVTEPLHAMGARIATTDAELNAYPIRSPASAYAFENVRITTTFGCRASRRCGLLAPGSVRYSTYA